MRRLSLFLFIISISLCFGGGLLAAEDKVSQYIEWSKRAQALYQTHQQPLLTALNQERGETEILQAFDKVLLNDKTYSALEKTEQFSVLKILLFSLTQEQHHQLSETIWRQFVTTFGEVTQAKVMRERALAEKLPIWERYEEEIIETIKLPTTSSRAELTRFIGQTTTVADLRNKYLTVASVCSKERISLCQPLFTAAKVSLALNLASSLIETELKRDGSLTTDLTSYLARFPAPFNAALLALATQLEISYQLEAFSLFIIKEFEERLLKNNTNFINAFGMNGFNHVPLSEGAQQALDELKKLVAEKEPIHQASETKFQLKEFLNQYQPLTFLENKTLQARGVKDIDTILSQLFKNEELIISAGNTKLPITLLNPVVQENLKQTLLLSTLAHTWLANHQMVESYDIFNGEFKMIQEVKLAKISSVLGSSKMRAFSLALQGYLERHLPLSKEERQEWLNSLQGKLHKTVRYNNVLGQETPRTYLVLLDALRRQTRGRKIWGDPGASVYQEFTRNAIVKMTDIGIGSYGEQKGIANEHINYSTIELAKLDGFIGAATLARWNAFNKSFNDRFRAEEAAGNSTPSEEKIRLYRELIGGLEANLWQQYVATTYTLNSFLADYAFLTISLAGGGPGAFLYLKGFELSAPAFEFLSESHRLLFRKWGASPWQAEALTFGVSNIIPFAFGGTKSLLQQRGQTLVRSSASQMIGQAFRSGAQMAVTYSAFQIGITTTKQFFYQMALSKKSFWDMHPDEQQVFLNSIARSTVMDLSKGASGAASFFSAAGFWKVMSVDELEFLQAAPELLSRALAIRSGEGITIERQGKLYTLKGDAAMVALLGEFFAELMDLYDVWSSQLVNRLISTESQLVELKEVRMPDGTLIKLPGGAGKRLGIHYGLANKSIKGATLTQDRGGWNIRDILLSTSQSLFTNASTAYSKKEPLQLSQKGLEVLTHEFIERAMLQQEVPGLEKLAEKHSLKEAKAKLAEYISQIATSTLHQEGGEWVVTLYSPRRTNQSITVPIHNEAALADALKESLPHQLQGFEQMVGLKRFHHQVIQTGQKADEFFKYRTSQEQAIVDLGTAPYNFENIIDYFLDFHELYKGTNYPSENLIKNLKVKEFLKRRELLNKILYQIAHKATHGEIEKFDTATLKQNIYRLNGKEISGSELLNYYFYFKRVEQFFYPRDVIYQVVDFGPFPGWKAKSPAIGKKPYYDNVVRDLLNFQQEKTAALPFSKYQEIAKNKIQQVAIKIEQETKPRTSLSERRIYIFPPDVKIGHHALLYSAIAGQSLKEVEAGNFKEVVYFSPFKDSIMVSNPSEGLMLRKQQLSERDEFSPENVLAEIGPDLKEGDVVAFVSWSSKFDESLSIVLKEKGVAYEQIMLPRDLVESHDPSQKGYEYLYQVLKESSLGKFFSAKNPINHEELKKLFVYPETLQETLGEVHQKHLELAGFSNQEFELWNFYSTVQGWIADDEDLELAVKLLQTRLDEFPNSLQVIAPVFKSNEYIHGWGVLDRWRNPVEKLKKQYPGRILDLSMVQLPYYYQYLVLKSQNFFTIDTGSAHIAMKLKEPKQVHVWVANSAHRGRELAWVLEKWARYYFFGYKGYKEKEILERIRQIPFVQAEQKKDG